MSSAAPSWPKRRFSQAISEGDGISVIPLVRGALELLADASEHAGAEALAVGSVSDLRRLRPRTELPLLVRSAVDDADTMRSLRAAGADACVLVYEQLAEDDALLEELVSLAWELGLDVALDVSDEEQLEEALERVDPEILVLSERDRELDEVETEVTLDLLPDVPAGKLVVSDSAVTTREQVLELERAGVDAVLVSELPGDPAYGAALAELTGTSG
ncbi:MAG: hypothetical protein U0R69_04280 [Gaiellales bacterium]